MRVRKVPGVTSQDFQAGGESEGEKLGTTSKRTEVMRMKDCLFPRGCDSARVIPVIETQSARGSGAADQPTRVVVEYWSLTGEKLAERDNYPRGMDSASSKASSDST